MKAASGKSYEAHTELNVTGEGLLKGEDFLFHAERVTVETTDSKNNGNSNAVALLALDGQAHEVVEDYVEYIADTEREKTKQIAPPKYEFYPMGYERLKKARLVAR